LSGTEQALYVRCTHGGEEQVDVACVEGLELLCAPHGDDDLEVEVDLALFGDQVGHYFFFVE